MTYFIPFKLKKLLNLIHNDGLNNIILDLPNIKVMDQKNQSLIHRNSNITSSQNIAMLLGLNENGQEGKRQRQCQRCQQYIQLIAIYQQKSQRFIKKEEKLKQILKKLQEQNAQVMKDADLAVKDFESITKQLQKQIQERDNFINNQNNEIQQLKIQLQEQQRYYEQIQKELREKLAIVSSQMKEKNKKLQKKYKEELTSKVNQTHGLKYQILKLISQKNLNQQKIRQQTKRYEVQIFQLEQEIKSFESQIHNKEKLIKFLSESNNEIRMQLIELKSKLEVQEWTWATEKKKSYIHSIEEDMNKELKRENEQLRDITQNLQNSIENLLMETEEMETILVKTKLERDILQKTVEQELNSCKSKYLHNKSLQQLHQRRYSEQNQNNIIRLPGFIRNNRTAQTSIKTSIRNEILQQDLEHNNN